MTTKNTLLLFLSLALLSLSGCNNQQNKKQQSNNISGDLIIFHAGSLSVPFKQVAAEFKKEHPNVNILPESAGSVKCARKIVDLNRPCDIMASADYTVIDNMLIPDYASWNIKFASNEMCIVYSEKSKHAEEINKDNWYDILLKDDVIYGRSNPNLDPCGYRAIIVSKLAELYYSKPELADKILSKDNLYIRPKEVDLLALLEAGTIDYIFLYRSVAQQHNLKYLILPDEINLKSPEFADFYKKASVDIAGKTPDSKVTKHGEPMVYGITIPKSSPNPKAAMAFVKFLLSKDKGMAIMNKNGQPSVIPSKTSSYDNLPDELKQFATK